MENKENLEEMMESSIIETTDENGETYHFEIVDIFSVEEKEYAALIRVSEDGTPLETDEEEELILMRVIDNGDEQVFEEIEDDDEFQKVVDAFENEIDDEDEE